MEGDRSVRGQMTNRAVSVLAISCSAPVLRDFNSPQTLFTRRWVTLILETGVFRPTFSYD